MDIFRLKHLVSWQIFSAFNFFKHNCIDMLQRRVFAVVFVLVFFGSMSDHTCFAEFVRLPLSPSLSLSVSLSVSVPVSVCLSLPLSLSSNMSAKILTDVCKVHSDLNEISV